MMADEPSESASKKLYIETVGCQMNLLDSELVVAKLRNDGYELTDDLNQADLVLYNTCSVRQHAEDKIYRRWGGSSGSRSGSRGWRSACWVAWRRKTRSRFPARTACRRGCGAGSACEGGRAGRAIAAGRRRGRLR